MTGSHTNIMSLLFAFSSNTSECTCSRNDLAPTYPVYAIVKVGKAVKEYNYNNGIPVRRCE